jgi:hypothetical protein
MQYDSSIVKPERIEPGSPIGWLILCGCGHGIGVHSRAGCRPAGAAACACRRDGQAVLDSAIAQAALELQAAMPPTARRRRR